MRCRAVASSKEKDTQVSGDTETAGDFTAALDKNRLLNIKPQLAGQEQEAIRTLGK